MGPVCSSRLGTPGSAVFVAIDSSKEWLLCCLSLLHTNLGQMHCELADLGSAVLTLARVCSQAAQDPDSCCLSSAQIPHIRNRVSAAVVTFPFLPCATCTWAALLIRTPSPRCPRSSSAPCPMLRTQSSSQPSSQPSPGWPPMLETGLHTAAPSTSAELATLTSYAHQFIPLLLDGVDTVAVTDLRFASAVECIAAWPAISLPLPLPLPRWSQQQWQRRHDPATRAAGALLPPSGFQGWPAPGWAQQVRQLHTQAADRTRDLRPANVESQDGPRQVRALH